MQLSFGSKGGDGKQSPVVAVVLIVVILLAVFLFARNFLGGGPEELPTAGSAPMAPPPGPGPALGDPGMPAGGTTPDAGAPGPSATAPPDSAPTPAAPSAPAASAASAASSAPSGPQNTMKVFGAVTVTYPKGWGVDISAASTAGVFTNGKAYFEVHPPDPLAKDAKGMADSALKTLLKGATVTAQAAEKIGNNDAYWYAARQGGTTVRVVGLDAPTRVVLVCYVKGGSFDSYRGTFDTMQKSLRF